MIGVVIVSYRSDERTVSFVREELSKVTVPHLTVVVDNGAGPAEAQTLQERLKGLATVIPAENGGFAKGNNIGFRWLEEQGGVDYILFTNNDIHLESGEVVPVLLESLRNHPDAGMAGPEIVGIDGKRQSPEPYMGLWDRFVWPYLSTPFLSAAQKRKHFQLDYAEKAGEGYHYRLMGSFVLVDAKAFAEVGGFDEGTFLYAEELILSERFLAIGKKCYFCPSVRVIHEHGATVSKHLTSRTAALAQFDSNAYYYRNYKGYGFLSTGFARLAFRTVLLLK